MDLLAGPAWSPGATRSPAFDGPRVLHIVGSLQGGGAERCVRDLVPRLRSRGIDAEIATVYPPNLDRADLAALGCAVHSRPKRPGFDIAHNFWLARTIARRKPAIVHTHMQSGKYVGRLAAMLANVPTIVHTEHSPNPLTRYERLYIQLFWRSTAVVVAFGEGNAKTVRGRERVRRVEIVRNGVAIGSQPGLGERLAARERLDVADSNTVVFAIVASLQARKNHALAFAALARIKDEAGPPMRLDLFGDGPMRGELEGLAASLGIASLVRFHGFEPDVVRVLPGVDVLLSASRLEMAPISFLEAMAAGIPIVAAPHGGTDDIIEDGITGRVAGWDVSSFSDAMRRARIDGAWRSSCGGAGRLRVERNHDIESIADQHVDLYRRLMASSGPIA